MRPMYVVVVIAAALLAVAAYMVMHSSATPPAQQSPSRTYSQAFCVNGLPATGAALSLALSNGVRCFRTDIAFTPSEIGFVANATASGAQYLGILDYDTLGAQPSQRGCLSGCNWTIAAWNASVSKAIAKYPEVHEWEIYNEPLASLFMSGYDNGSALNYFNMIRSASMIIKAREPNATVVCFGGAELFPVQQVEQEYSFYKKVWQYGASRYCDAISIHVYSLPLYSLNQSVGANYTLGMLYNLTLNLYENMTGKPVWITETGITSNNFTAGLNLSEQKQASFLAQDLGFFSKYAFVKRIYWFDFSDSTNNGQDYGLLNSTMQPKPSWYAFLGFVHNSTATS